MLCECDLRHRQWNPFSGRCLTCGCTYKDERMPTTKAPPPREAMRFVSLSNPWPWAIFHPDPAIAKLIENRTWPAPREQIGKRIAIHAAKSWDPDATRYWISLGIEGWPMRKDLYPTSAIVGVVTIDRVRTMVNPGVKDASDPTGGRYLELPIYPEDLPEIQRKWFFGPFGWFLRDPIKLATPIPMKGGQGMRALAPEIQVLVDAQLVELGAAA